MTRLQPLHDYLLVKLDPTPSSIGSIVLPPDTTSSSVRTGTVLQAGMGKKIEEKRLHPGVEPGEKVAFLRWHLEHKTGKQLSSTLRELDEDVALIREADVLFAFTEGTTVGA